MQYVLVRLPTEMIHTFRLCIGENVSPAIERPPSPRDLFRFLYRKPLVNSSFSSGKTQTTSLLARVDNVSYQSSCVCLCMFHPTYEETHNAAETDRNLYLHIRIGLLYVCLTYKIQDTENAFAYEIRKTVWR